MKLIRFGELGKEKPGVVINRQMYDMNRWTRDLSASGYKVMNEFASHVNPGSDELIVFPFGNGAERIFENKIIGAHILNIDLNKHSKAHVFRAVQEGIVFSFKYGLEIMKENGIKPSVMRVGRANMESLKGKIYGVC